VASILGYQNLVIEDSGESGWTELLNGIAEGKGVKGATRPAMPLRTENDMGAFGGVSLGRRGGNRL
jgi:hypothetical protein